MSAVIVSNFDVVERNADITFPFAGTWYDYFDGTELTLTATTTTLSLRQGEFHIYTNYPLETPELILSAESIVPGKIVTHPNPTTDYISVSSDVDPLYYFLYDLQGRELRRGKFTNVQTTIDLSSYNSGIILLEVITRSGERFMDKIIKQ